MISLSPQWLKIAPLLATAGWLIVTHKLLRRMGASFEGALFIVMLTAASPTIVFLATSLMSEALFALLSTAALLMLLDERPAIAGLLAGGAMLTRSAGVALIAACILILTIRRRFRNGMWFTAAAVLVVAPWIGWSLAHKVNDPYYSPANYASLNILTSLAANEKVIVFGRNLIYMFATPYALLTGYNNLFAAIGTLLVFGWCLYVRRQTIPDLYVAVYCAMILCWAGPPHRFLAAILPLLLWMFWRVFRLWNIKEALAAGVVISALLPLWADAIRIPASREAGYFEYSGNTGENWGEMQKLFAGIRANTPPDAVLLANLDPVFYLYTGRKAVRGFSPNGYQVFYAPKQTLVTPDELLDSIRNQGVSYVVVSPDRDYAEAPLFHKTVDALERGGILEPVPIDGLDADYKLLRVARTSY